MTGRTIALRVILKSPPAGVDFAIQSGKGAQYETIGTTRSTGADVFLDATALVRDGKMAGPIVQGPPATRFLYVDIGVYAGQHDCPWGRRLKIPLTGLTPEMLAEGNRLETVVTGTGKDGGPLCGTAKPFDGWRALRSSAGN